MARSREACLAKAREAEELAARARTAYDRTLWLEMAVNWRRLADAAMPADQEHPA